MRKSILLLILLIFIIPWISFSQEGIYLDWADDEYEIEVKLPDYDEILNADAIYDLAGSIYDLAIPVGSIIYTNGTYAEFYMANGSILKLSKNSSIQIDSLTGINGGSSNDFSLTGKLRMVAAKATGSTKSKYTVRTGSTVCGVRGTDYLVDETSGKVYLKNGEIFLTNNDTGKQLTLSPGQGSNLFGNLFKAFAVTAEAFAELYEEFTFISLNPDSVPGNELENPPSAEGDEDKDTGDQADAVIQPPVDSSDLEGKAKDEEAASKPAAPSFMDPVMEFLRDYLGFEIGSITINGETYSKAVIQPEFQLGKLGLSLYLPIIYKNDMFDPEDWHHPDGNDEWSFGFDVAREGGNWMDITADVLSDLFLKIRYVKWGDIRDDFFFKVGNLNDLTVGHGMFMYNYANDADFPSIRKVGFNLGLDFGKLGFEAVVDDLAKPEIFGGRVYFRPFGDFMAIGVSSITDIMPGGVLSSDEAANNGNPLFINAGIDLDFPIIKDALIFGTDLGGMLPILRQDALVDGVTIPSTSIDNWWSIFYNPDESLDFFSRLRNYGFKAGFFGNIFGVDYNLEFRYYNGKFKPSFFNSTYDRVRGLNVIDTIGYMSTMNDEFNTEPEYTMGIFGGTEFSILKKVGIELSYMWPWYIDKENQKVMVGDDDYFHFSVSIAEGVIPVLGIYGSVYYTRTSFIPTLLKGSPGYEDFGGFDLFDANTVVGGEIVYPVADTLDIVGTVTTTIKKIIVDGEEVIYYKENGQPNIVPSIGIETRVHF